MKFLLPLIAALFFSAHASAAVIREDFGYTLGYLDEQNNYEYEFWTSGTASIFFEEGTTELSTLQLFDDNNDLLFTSSTSTNLVFVNTRFGNSTPLTMWNDGYSTSAMTMQSASDSTTGSLRFTRDLMAMSDVPKVTATVDDWTGIGHGVFSLNGRVAMFDTHGVISSLSSLSAKSAEVPEPSSMILLGTCLLGLLAPMRKKRDA